MRPVILRSDETKYGAVETRADARRVPTCSPNRDEIAGVIVTLPNFGDEAPSATRCGRARPRRAGAGPGLARTKRQNGHRPPPRQFCGKMSACNVLTQYGIPYSLTSLHTEHPESRGISRAISSGSPRSAAWCADCAPPASARSARVPPRSRRCATARRSSKRTASR